MPDLELQLRALAEEAVWPATPDIAAAVARAPRERTAGARLRAALAPRGRRARRILAAGLALLLLVPAAAVAFPGARNDVLEWLGLRDVEIRRVPAPPPGTRPELEPDLGRVVPLAQARARGRLHGRGPGRARRARPRARPRPADLADLRAARGPAAARRGRRRADPHRVARGDPRRLSPEAPAGRRDRRAREGRRPPRRLHRAAITPTSTRRPDGRVHEEQPLLAGPTLIWTGRGRVYRLESAAQRAESAAKSPVPSAAKGARPRE